MYRGETEFPVGFKVRFMRYWCGCDFCKKKKSTQQFIGFAGDVLYICRECFNEITGFKSQIKKNQTKKKSKKKNKGSFRDFL